MNIFIMLLALFFMAGYYIISSPSQTIAKHETTEAIKKADLRSIVECVVSTQNAVMYGEDFIDICTEKYSISSQYICMDEKSNITECDSTDTKEPALNFIITSSSIIPTQYYNSMLDILEQYYPDAGTFGILQNNQIISANSVTNRTIPENIIKASQLQNGQLIYVMQYKIPKMQIDYPTEDISDIVCPTGTVKTYRFGRWQCIGYNYKISCTGDTIWDSYSEQCIADESRKPLCSSNQTAILVDDVWECIDPFADKTCETGMVARLNYNDLQWECVEDPTIQKQEVKKCDLSKTQYTTKGIAGKTLRLVTTSCTDCEKMVINEDTCESYCIPDETQLYNPQCYNDAPTLCTGTSRAIYFGFSSNSVVTNISDLDKKDIIIDEQHSQNRKFNCLDCGMGSIDTEKSIFPYTAVCK